MTGEPGSDRGGRQGPGDATFITRLDPTPGPGPLLAVKDNIDVAGVVTTCGSAVIAVHAAPAVSDATCVATARAAGARIVGKANLHELGIGGSGINEWSGTPVNPLDPSRVPGGSSSGPSVAVATGQADVAFGTDAGGSCRVPPACCGVAGLKTTWGRVPVDGVHLITPSQDTVGPIARDAAGLVRGMRLLEPGFEVAGRGPRRVGRLRVPADPAIDAAVDRALEAWGVDVVAVELELWRAGFDVMSLVFMLEFFALHRYLLEEHADELTPGVAATLRFAASVTAEQRDECQAKRRAFTAELDGLLAEVDALALPTMPVFPPPLATEDKAGMTLVPDTAPLNPAGVPAVVLPVPSDGPLPASLQLAGARDREDLLLAAALEVEAALAERG